MKIIGITGKSGSGKSTLAKLLVQKLNCTLINIDEIGHDALLDSKNYSILCEKLGNEILDENKKIDRKKVGAIVFRSKEKMDILTNITWNYMQEKIDTILEETSKLKQSNYFQCEKYIILEWALLPTCKYWSMCNYKILVNANIDLRKEHVIKRDNISKEYFDVRENSSVDYFNFKFDLIVKNNYDVKRFEKNVDKICTKLL